MNRDNRTAGAKFLALPKQTVKRLLLKIGALNRNAHVLGLRRLYSDDIFLCSYPKSGNTWLRFLIANLTCGKKKELSFINIHEFVPDIYHHKRIINSLPPSRVIKTHDPLFDMYPRVLYMVRDPRDVYVSYFHYCVNNGWFSNSISEFFEPFSDGRFTGGVWSEHVTAAANFAKQYPNRILIVKYESMLEDSMGAALQVAEFMGMQISTVDVCAAVQAASFDNLRSMEIKHGSEFSRQNKSFFRKGVIGDWREELSEELVQRICQRNSAAMQIMGYEV